jgi:hypothetical protein
LRWVGSPRSLRSLPSGGSATHTPDRRLLRSVRLRFCSLRIAILSMTRVRFWC